jgi:hypothetical protein
MTWSASGDARTDDQGWLDVRRQGDWLRSRARPSRPTAAGGVLIVPESMMVQRPRVMAVASAGGHWTQLMRLAPALQGCDLVFVSTRDQSPLPDGARFHVVPDANRSERLAMIRLILRMAWIVRRERPEVVVSTGAAPGFIAIRIARLFGARTIWLDSLANVDELSMSGRLVGSHSDLWLTQWPHLARPEGPHFVGSIL